MAILLSVAVYSVMKPEPVSKNGSAVHQARTSEQEDLQESQGNKDSSGKDVQGEEKPKDVMAENKVNDNGNAAEAEKVSPLTAQKAALEITTPRGDCWMEVTVDGKRVFYKLVPKGSKPLKFNGEKKVSVFFGNTGAVDIKFNGKDLGPAVLWEVL